jgi:hypothetical protein
MSQRHPEILKVLLLFVVFSLAFNMIFCTFLPYSVPGIPKNLTLTPDNTSVLIKWTDTSSRTVSFVIERRKGFADAFAVIASPLGDVSEYLDSPVEAQTQYSYRIKAIGSTGYESVYSDEKNTITWAILGTQANPDPTNNPIFANPTEEHSYQITATVSSAGDTKDATKWSYHKADINSYVNLAGNYNKDFITDPLSKFVNKRYGQFVIKLNGASEWTIFTDNDWQTDTSGYIYATVNTPWYGGMADYPDPLVPDETDPWLDNWGQCLVVITDVTN